MAFEIKDEHIFDLRTIFEKNRKIWGSILESFYIPKSYFWGFKRVPKINFTDKVDFESVLASILGRFSKAWERQK